MEKRPVGRPRGYVMSEESREKTSRSRLNLSGQLIELLTFMREWMPERDRLIARNAVLEAELKRRMDKELRGH